MNAMEMFGLLARHFGVPRAAIGYAGLKDKQAITRQVVSVHTPGKTVDDFPHFEFLRTTEWVMPGLQNASNVLENWCDEFKYMTQNTDWGLLGYTFHPLVIGRGHRMLMLERLILNLQEQGAEFLTLEEGARRFQARPG